MPTYAAVDGLGLAGGSPRFRRFASGSAATPPAWRIREVGDGNLNLVFIVEGADGGVVVKQALPYVRLVGECWPLPLERSFFEYQRADRAGPPRARPDARDVPLRRAQAMIVMEYLSPHVIMRKGLIGGVRISALRGDIAAFLAAHLVSHLSARGNGGRRTRRASRCSPRTRRSATSPRISSSPTPIARRRSIAGRDPGSMPRSRRSSATAR